MATGSEFPQNLAALLQKNGWCSPELLSQAAQLARQTGRGLGTTLMDMGALSDEQLYGAYSELTGLPRWQKNGEPLGDSDLSPQFMQQNNVLAWRAPDGIYLVLADAEDRGLIDLLHRMYPQAQLAIAPASDIQFYLQQNSAKGAKLESGGALDVEYLKDLALEAPIIRQVNDLILMGVKIGASDIHLEPLKGQVVLRYRIDGVLQTRPGPKSEEYPALVSRLKILANLDIAERRLPQDGRFSLKASGRDVDIRLSTMPTPFGEDVALRLLDQKKELLALDSLGLDKAVTNPLRDVLRRSHGLILVTGPTGSGKTTTLYSALGSIIDGMKKIITVEDPVEYDIPGITQVPVNADIGMGFASALRSILRHDPDVILVGEIRDKETAEIAVQAALTGHLVLSTVHTNSAPAAIARLIQMGVADYLLSSSLL
ncbi:MAG: GspE/PulE family protein, partial [Dongiaceae bacterium]